MTLRAHVFGLFPAFWLIAVAAGFLAVITMPGAVTILALLCILYLLPVACFRIHDIIWPLTEGRSRLDMPHYSPWWGSHQFQVMYSAFPALEAALRLVPGVYSIWLRAWGSKIGRRIYWTPRVHISDRSLLEIGDDVIFGHLVACYAHLIKRRSDGVVLYVRRIRIGNRVFLGGTSRIGPGVRIEDDVVLKGRTDIPPGRLVQLGHE